MVRGFGLYLIFFKLLIDNRADFRNVSKYVELTPICDETSSACGALFPIGDRLCSGRRNGQRFNRNEIRQDPQVLLEDLFACRLLETLVSNKPSCLFLLRKDGR